MSILDNWKEWTGVTSKKEEIKEELRAEIKAEVQNVSSGFGYTGGWTFSFDGEKNLGEMGEPKHYVLEHQRLRTRSWQSYLENEITQTIIGRFTTWVIGAGLKLQAEPNVKFLKQEKINLDFNNFSESIEERWKVYANSKIGDYRGQSTLNKVMNTAFKNALLGGDVLVVLRYVNKNLTVELIDGAYLGTPRQHKGKNKIINGVEIDKTGNHIAYHIKTKSFETERIVAYGAKSKRRMAYLIYGQEYRMDDFRGIPIISTVLETLSKLDRYKEAMVSGAESRAKIAYSIEHGVTSTGEDPFADRIATAFNPTSKDDLPITIDGKELADQTTVSVGNTAVNMPNDSKLIMHDSKQELTFEEFYKVNFDLVCAAIQIPPNVAKSKYDDNFSASRAALKDWEHTLNVERKKFSDQFIQPIYDLFLEIQILTNKIQAQGYLTALQNKDEMILSAYRQSRFVGATVPHIDPLKEVNAERAKLGALGGNIPLTTVERATEALNSGDSNSNMQKFAEEFTESKTLKLVDEPVAPITVKE